MNLTDHIMHILLPARASAAESFQLLAPISGMTNPLVEGEKFSSYLQVIFDISLGIAITLAIIVMIYGGFQYLSTDAAWGKEDGKQKLTRSLWGLLIGLGIFIILNTLNPNLLKLDLTLTELKPIAAKPTEPGTPGTPPGGPVYTACSDCSTLSDLGIPNKGPSAAGGTGACLNAVPACKANSDLANRLQAFKQGLGSGITWTISEAWPPTRTHQALCHRDGTCVDLSMSQRATDPIKRVISAADTAGLKAVYEVESTTRRNQLMDDGVPALNVLYVAGITGEHFSIYKK